MASRRAVASGTFSGKGVPIISPRKSVARAAVSPSRCRETRARSFSRRASSDSPAWMPACARIIWEHRPKAAPAPTGSPAADHTCTSPRARTRPTSSCARRVFPTPGAAVTMTALAVSSSDARASALSRSARSASRPTHGVGLPRRVRTASRRSRAPASTRPAASPSTSKRASSRPAVTWSMRRPRRGRGARSRRAARSSASPTGRAPAPVATVRPVASASVPSGAAAASASAHAAVRRA